MRTFVLFIFFLNARSVFSQLEFTRNPAYPLKTIFFYCRADSVHPAATIQCTYNKNRKISKTVYSATDLFNPNGEKTVTEFNYNNAGLLVSEETYYVKGAAETEHRRRIFTYNEKSQLVSEGDENKKIDILNFYTDDGQLNRKELYGKTYNYFYSKNGQLIKVEYNTDAFTTYEYANGLLIKEEYENRYNVHTKKYLYTYNEAGQLLSKTDDGNIVEENEYLDGRLNEKQTYYFGPGPCFNWPCCGEDIFRFEYYKD